MLPAASEDQAPSFHGPAFPPRTPAALEGGRVPGRSWWAESRPHGQQGQTSHCPLSTTRPPSGPLGGCSDLCRHRASQAVSRCAFPTRGLVWLSCPCPHAVDFYTPSQAAACLCWSCQPLSCLLARACLGCRVLPGSASPGPRLGAVWGAGVSGGPSGFLYVAGHLGTCEGA